MMVGQIWGYLESQVTSIMTKVPPEIAVRHITFLLRMITYAHKQMMFGKCFSAVGPVLSACVPFPSFSTQALFNEGRSLQRRHSRPKGPGSIVFLSTGFVCGG